MKKKRNRGEIVSGFTAMLAVIVIGIAQAGVLFTGGPGAVAGSTMFLTAIGGTGLATQLDASVDPFRKKKAIAMCEETGASQCETMVGSWSKADILDYIKDDEPAQIVTNGGNFVGGNMNP